ncbi:MAG: hypothetical protein E7I62_16105 [Bilophila wadsworthia]|jgi:hypothetical protein|uniref:hypothetical protein n=1 Tax=Bilophila wadsworthia TaxID=35833 RepID=UPI002914DC96|nr:hypothetical protein [Bilophila wadsworthia]MDU4377115.1 hypothetical protein [Bilophila wadsworthia]
MNTIKNTFSVSPVRFTVACMGMAAVWLFAPEIVHAAVTFGEIGQNIADNSKGVARGITMAGYAAGAGMGVWGCVDMYKATKNQGQSTYAGGLTKVVIGALALGLGELLGSGSATLFGSDQTSGMGDLGL